MYVNENVRESTDIYMYISICTWMFFYIYRSKLVISHKVFIYEKEL
jgi:hypothetical protein